MHKPRGELRIWNWYLYTYLVSAAAMIVGGWLYSRIGKALAAPWSYLTKSLPACGIILLFLLFNIEIADFYSTGTAITFNFTATLAQDMTYTLALLVTTILKCFVHDLARLGELYRVASFVGLAVCLALVAVALQKYVLAARKEEK